MSKMVGLMQDAGLGPDLDLKTPKYVNKILIDWLRSSVLVRHWSAVNALLDLQDREWEEMNIYNRKYVCFPCEGVKVCSDFLPALDGLSLEDAEPDNTFIVDFSGNGLGVWLDANGYATVEKLIAFFMSLEGTRINRLDIAYDDHKGLLDVRRMDKWLRDGHTSTRWRKASLLDSYEIGGVSTGVTLYVGRRRSQSFLRVYDKVKQEMSRGAVASALPERWVRSELELKGDLATAVAETCLLNFTPSFFAGILREKIDFKSTKSHDLTLHRRPTVQWWDRFLWGTKEQKVCIPRPVRSIERVEKWLDKFVMPSLALVVSHRGYHNRSWLDRSIIDAYQRIPANKWALLHTHGS